MPEVNPSVGPGLLGAAPRNARDLQHTHCGAACPARVKTVVPLAADLHDLPAYAGGLKRLRARRLRLPDGFSTGPGGWAGFRFAVGQAVLGFGAGAAAPVRAWYLRFRWAEERRKNGLRGALRMLAGEPVRALRETRHNVARYGPACRREFGVSLGTQWRQLLWLRLARGVHVSTYYQYQIFRPERRRVVSHYLQHNESTVVYRVLAYREAVDDYLLLEDKRRLERWCRERAIPTVRTVAEFEGGRLTAVEPDYADGAPPSGRDLFSKPIDLNGGMGAQRWRWVDGVWHDEAGTPHDRAAVFAVLADASRERGQLLQECLVNAPELALLTTDALSTARIITTRGLGGDPEVVAGAFRIGLRGNATDNLHRGGVAVAIDVTTGRLGGAMRPDPATMIMPLQRHPDTGVAFEGFQLPRWAEATALAVRAHALLSHIAVVGWDVAFTPDGPVIVEGNFSPEPRLTQAPSGAPLGLTNHLRYLDAQLRRSYARRPIAAARPTLP